MYTTGTAYGDVFGNCSGVCFGTCSNHPLVALNLLSTEPPTHRNPIHLLNIAPLPKPESDFLTLIQALFTGIARAPHTEMYWGIAQAFVPVRPL